MSFKKDKQGGSGFNLFKRRSNAQSPPDPEEQPVQPAVDRPASERRSAPTSVLNAMASPEPVRAKRSAQLRRRGSAEHIFEHITREQQDMLRVGSQVSMAGASSEQSLESLASSAKQILLLYTGGTIGMVTTDSGYDVQPGYLETTLAHQPAFNDGRTPGKLAIPKSPAGHRIEYKIQEYDPIVDSSDMSVKDWVRIASDIEREYHSYDGFIVLHGTDTMAH